MVAISPEQFTKAEEAFEAYVRLGKGRTLRALANNLVQQDVYKNVDSAFRQLGRWSSQHKWQQRIREASTARSIELLREAEEADAETFEHSSRILNQRLIEHGERLDLRDVVQIRESVRKPMPKGTTVDVNVNVGIEVRQLIEQIAEEDGLTEDEKRELHDSVQHILTGAS